MSNLQKALDAYKNGDLIIVTDDADRENEGDLMLLAVEAEPLGSALKWEVSRGDQLFPHLYRPLMLTDVHWALPLPEVGGAHQFPAGLEDASV